jgi:chromatin segregation and condensation protein Rec8/ScpA/Scc1 (kleisin family)
MPFGFKPLDQLLDDLIRKYKISPEDIIALEMAIQKYLEYIEEAWQQAEAGEI